MTNLHIMVVEDDKDTLEFLAEFLSLQGYEVIPWRTSSGVVERIEQHQPNLVLLDHRLDKPPYGREIFLALRAHPSTAQIPVLLYSAEHMVVRSFRDDARAQHGDVIEKPFKLDDLLAKIEELTTTTGASKSAR